MANDTISTSSSDSDVECVKSVDPPGPRRLTFEEESSMERLSLACCARALPNIPHGLSIAVQRSDTCLVHAIINATQCHDRLDAMLRAVRTVDGIKRKDVVAGVECARRILGARIHVGFDVTTSHMGIAHIYMACGEGHFIALRRHTDGVIYVLDSINGKMAALIDSNQFRLRSTPYTIVL